MPGIVVLNGVGGRRSSCLGGDAMQGVLNAPNQYVSKMIDLVDKYDRGPMKCDDFLNLSEAFPGLVTGGAVDDIVKYFETITDLKPNEYDQIKNWFQDFVNKEEISGWPCREEKRRSKAQAYANKKLVDLKAKVNNPNPYGSGDPGNSGDPGGYNGGDGTGDVSSYTECMSVYGSESFCRMRFPKRGGNGDGNGDGDGLLAGFGNLKGLLFAGGIAAAIAFFNKDED